MDNDGLRESCLSCGQRKYLGVPPAFYVCDCCISMAGSLQVQLLIKYAVASLNERILTAYLRSGRRIAYDDAVPN